MSPPGADAGHVAVDPAAGRRDHDPGRIVPEGSPAIDYIVLMLAMLVGLRVLLVRIAPYLRVDGPPGWPLGTESRESYWQRVLPWPRGVQEDSEIAWHVPRSEAPVGSPATREAGRPSAGTRPAPPTRPQPRFSGR
jgi:hypothetical protein